MTQGLFPQFIAAVAPSDFPNDDDEISLHDADVSSAGVQGSLIKLDISFLFVLKEFQLMLLIFFALISNYRIRRL